MQNTYQEKLADLEVNNSKKIKKLEGGINFKIKSDFQPSGCLLYTSDAADE